MRLRTAGPLFSACFRSPITADGRIWLSLFGMMTKTRIMRVMRIMRKEMKMEISQDSWRSRFHVQRLSARKRST